MDPIIELVDIHKVYDLGEVPVRALDGVSLTVRQGEFVAILGSSGSGKSTLMNLIGCLDQPTSGQYRFLGQEVGPMGRNQLAALRNRSIGFVFQGFNLLPRTSALDNVQLPLLYTKCLRPAERAARAKELLVKFGLGDRLRHRPNQLSGGQQQRVAIARALVNRPQVLLADEPTGNLDSRTGLEILAEFQRLNRDEGQTILMVTHDPQTAHCCQRQIVMRDGRLIEDRRLDQPLDARAELQRWLAGQQHATSGVGR